MSKIVILKRNQFDLRWWLPFLRIVFEPFKYWNHVTDMQMRPLPILLFPVHYLFVLYSALLFYEFKWMLLNSKRWTTFFAHAPRFDVESHLMDTSITYFVRASLIFCVLDLQRINLICICLIAIHEMRFLPKHKRQGRIKIKCVL